MNHRTRIIARYLFVVLLGVFLSFAFALSGGNLIVGLFAPINTSVWESLKLIFYPMLVLTIWDLFTNYRNNTNFLPARTIGILAGMTFFVVVYYTITGIIGMNITWINVLIYLLAVAFAFWVERKVYKRCIKLSTTLAIVILIIFIILFTIFTLAPPALGIFIPAVA